MTNYADYAYYTDTYEGAVIDTASFDLYAARATQKIKFYTFNRIADDNIPDEAKMCCCDIADTIYRAEKLDHGNIASEKVGEHSVSYENQTDFDKRLKRTISESINNWLAMTGLLYRGCM